LRDLFPLHCLSPAAFIKNDPVGIPTESYHYSPIESIGLHSFAAVLHGPPGALAGPAYFTFSTRNVTVS
jgi:hypothetical protein